jgi:hypothetical protein
MEPPRNLEANAKLGEARDDIIFITTWPTTARCTGRTSDLAHPSTSIDLSS